MRKHLIIALCAVCATFTLSSCQGSAQSDQAEVTPSVTAQATAEAEETENPEETTQPEETQKEERLVAPIDIDTDIDLEKGMRIAVVAKTTETGYWQNMKENMTEAVDYLNQEYELEGDDKITMTFEGPKDEEDVTSQINIIDAVLSENPSVLCLAAIDVNSCEAQLETASENGIPVIMFDSSVTSELATTYYGTNNVKAGKAAANKLCMSLGKKGEVAIFAHENITQTSKDRVRGFRNQVQEEYPEVVLNSITYENEEENLEDMIRSVLDSHENLGGIFCTNGTVTETVLEVLEDYPDRKIKLIGFDMGSKQKEAIKEGIEYGTIVQNTYEMAYDTIWAAARSASDEETKLEEKTYLKHIWIDASNLDAQENAQYLYD